MDDYGPETPRLGGGTFSTRRSVSTERYSVDRSRWNDGVGSPSTPQPASSSERSLLRQIPVPGDHLDGEYSSDNEGDDALGVAPRSPSAAIMEQFRRDRYVRLKELYHRRLSRRLFWFWIEAVEHSRIRDLHLEVRLRAIFMKYIGHRRMKWTFERWMESVWGDPAAMKGATQYYEYLLKWQALRRWKKWINERRLMRKVMKFFDYTLKWRAWQAILEWWRGVKGVSKLDDHRRYRNYLLMRSAFYTWIRNAADASQTSYLVLESAKLGRLHHFFLAWYGYLQGFKEGLQINPGNVSKPWTDSMQPFRRKAALTHLLKSTAVRRRGALVRNFKAAALWERLLTAFRAWAAQALADFMPQASIIEKSDAYSWYPLVRLIRLVHMDWALLAGEQSWQEGLANSQAVWHAFQVWKRLLHDAHLRRQKEHDLRLQRVEIARRWHSSRLAWRAFQGFLRAVYAARVAQNLCDQVSPFNP